MFGGEKGGYAAARPDLWKGGVVAVCVDGAEESAVEKVSALHRGLGAEVALCTAAEHDQAVASVSHLPYVLASALALTAREAGPLARKLAGKGLADMTRLADFAYEIQGEAARSNPHLSAAAESFEANLRVLLNALADSPDAARKALTRAREVKESLP
jgi:prephenate dehydrogenase